MAVPEAPPAAVAEPISPPPKRGPGTVEVRGLNHYFGEGELRNQILFDVNLHVMPGELVIISGPSGSGKSTLLVLVGTLRSVQEGSLKVLGDELLGAGAGDLIRLRRRIGFIFQAHNLFESLTAYENVKMALQLFGGAADERERIVGLLTRLNLGARIGHKPGQLSGGQKQRVAIARGLIHNPRLILADEPTAALDEENSRVVVDLLREHARQQGSTILMVTHDNRILDVADRIVTVEDGRIKSDMSVSETAVICRFLERCGLFAEMSAAQLIDVAERMRREDYPPGQTIIRQNDPGDKFYLIRSGRTQIFREQEGAPPRLLAEEREGDFFGEAALLTGEPRNATVVAAEDTVLYALSQEDFQHVLQTSHTFEQEVRRTLFMRR